MIEGNHHIKLSLLIINCFTDKTVGMFDTVTCQRIKRLKGHTGYVNSCSPGPSRGAPLVASASDDCSIKVWDTRHRLVEAL